MSEQAKCGLCGEPMPPGEEMFNYHGASGPCPKPAARELKAQLDAALALPKGSDAQVAALDALGRDLARMAQRTTRDPADYKLAQAGEKDE